MFLERGELLMSRRFVTKKQAVVWAEVARAVTERPTP
jgi:hypothetical protein